MESAVNVRERGVPALARDADAGAAAAFVRLDEGELWSHVPGADALAITCLVGVLWLTQAGNRDDVLLERGDHFVARGAGKIVAQALGGATFSVGRAV